MVQITIPDPSSVTPAQRKLARETLVNLSQEPDAQNKLSNDVRNAADAAANIANSFVTIGTKLQSVDSLNLQPDRFFPQWKGFRDRYTAILQTSKNHASKVAAYADRMSIGIYQPLASTEVLQEFEQVILTVVTDPSTPTEHKVTAVNNCFNQAVEFQQDSDSIFSAFSNLSSDITNFTATFNSFAADRKQADSTEIKELQEDIARLNKEIQDLKLAMSILGGIISAGAVCTEAASTMFPEFAPAIAFGAAIVAGIISVAETGMGVVLASDQSKVDEDNDKIKTLEAEIDLINEAQSQLNILAIDDIAKLTAQLSLLNAVWGDVASDSTKIADWLQDGASDADMPDIVTLYSEKAATMYGILSAALKDYATNVSRRLIKIGVI